MNAQQHAAADWLTVSQAAAALGVSERTIRRRCDKGKLRARLVTTDSGPAWFIDRADVPDVAAANAADTAAIAADTRANVKAAQDVPTAPDAADAAAIAADTRAADATAALIAEKGARINDLQKQLDAVNAALSREQSAHAETRRALAFAMSTPMLTATPPTAAPDVPADADAKAARPSRRRPRRPLWAALIGYRPKD